MSTRTMTRPMALAAAFAIAGLAPGGLAQSLDDRLERIVQKLDAGRREFHIPGLAIAIVKDDEIILARGLGEADVDGGRPATDETLFAVGSTTKAFTASLVGMLVDEGRMGWDDPVRKHLPDYHLTDAEADEQVVIRDLLCHRIGLASMTLLWYGNDVASEEILEASYGAELLHPFRTRWNYSNVSFLAAGEASAAAADTTWESLVADRLFEPLGMEASNTSIEAALSDPRMAKGYRWDQEDEQLVPMAMRRVSSVAPAGAINSNVRDMAQWVRLQLGHGELEGKRLLSEEQHEQTWTMHSNVGGDIDYGLGWFLRTWREQRVIEHAGGIDGFTAEVALLPDEGIGFVLLMNLFGAPLGEMSREIVFDGLVGEWVDDEKLAAAGEEDFKPYLGDYIATFAHFREATFEVLEQNDALAVDIPGQMVFALKPPDEEGWRQFALTDQIKLRFNTHEDGEVYSLTLQQAGYEFEVPKKGAEYPPGVDVEEVRRYFGLYRFDQLGADLEVLVQHNRLAVDIPNQMTAELHPPDEEDRWIFRPRATVWVRFNEGKEGAVESLTFSQDGTVFELPRTGDGSMTDLPTVDELMTLVRAAVAPGGDASFGSYRSRGRVHFPHMGVSGTTEFTIEDDLRRRETIDLGRFGGFRTEVDAESGRVVAAFMPDQDLEGERLEQLQINHPTIWIKDWRDFFEDVTVKGQTTFDDEEVFEVRLKGRAGTRLTVYVEVESGLVRGHRMAMLGALGGAVETTSRFGDHREVDGFLLPFRVEVENAVTGKTIVELEKLEPLAAR